VNAQPASRGATTGPSVARVVARADVTGVVLAGGQGRRMGGVDKGLVDFAGSPMVAHVIGRLAPQVGAMLINANQNADRYASFGYPVVADAIGGFAGPLAGLHAGLCAATTTHVVTSPCDSPFLPLDLVARLGAALATADAELAVARTGNQPHPVFALAATGVREHLANFMRDGGRKIDAWYSTLRVVEVAFDDQADAFRNINTRQELAQNLPPSS
jgi:molybdopterin-guanine dinucleotide biosynthesis protein A